MRVALRLHGGLPAAACVEQARAAERAGFSTVWFAENPFNRGVLPAMTACALATTTIRIGIGVFNPFNRHPTLVAMEIGALDELSGGRAVLGIGAGIKIAQMGLPVHRPIAAVRDAMQIIRPLLRGEEVDYAGKIFKAEKVWLEFPLRRASMPILMAAVGDQALRGHPVRAMRDRSRRGRGASARQEPGGLDAFGVLARKQGRAGDAIGAARLQRGRPRGVLADDGPPGQRREWRDRPP